MDELTHTLLATACIAGSFYAGKYLTKRNLIEDTVSSLLDNLEKEGLIAVKKSPKGDKDISPINEVIAKALRDAK